MTFSEDDLEVIFTKLDSRCWQCGGEGVFHVLGATTTDKCDICYGTGYQPTRAGVELLNFLGRHRRRSDEQRSEKR